MHNYKGSIWAMGCQRPDFEDYIGDMRHYLDYALDHRDGSPGMLRGHCHGVQT